MSTMLKLVIAAASGIVAGAAIGFLTAPHAGSETRQNISDATGKLTKRLGRIIGRASDELDELKDIIQNQSDGLSDDVRQKVLKLIASSKASYKNVVAEATA